MNKPPNLSLGGFLHIEKNTHLDENDAFNKINNNNNQNNGFTTLCI